LRRLLLTALPLGLCSFGITAQADPTLEIVSGSSSVSVRKSIPLTTAHYDLATRALVATTRSGNFICGGVAPTGNQPRLLLDATAYRVQTTSLPSGLQAPIQYSPGSTTFALSLFGTLTGAECLSSHSMGNLRLQFDAQLPSPNQLPSLPVAEQVYFDLPTKSFEIRVAEPTLCESFVNQSASSGLAIKLVDANFPVYSGTNAKVLPGFAGVDYTLSGVQLLAKAQTAAGLPRVQCSTPGAYRSLPTTGGEPPEPSGNAIFADGFEPEGGSTPPPGSGANLVVALEEIGVQPQANRNLWSSQAIAGSTLQYRLRVENPSEFNANQVRLREYVTGDSAIIRSGHSAPAAVVLESVACSRIGSPDPCPANAVFGGGQLLSLNTSIPAGQGFVFTLKRLIDAEAVAGQRSHLGYSAFVDPAVSPEADLSNNHAWVEVALIDNQAPIIAQPAHQSLAEISLADHADAEALEVAFTINENDAGDTLGAVTIGSNEPALFAQGELAVSCDAPSTPGPFSHDCVARIKPGPHANGLARVTLNAVDSAGSPAIARTFDVNVTAVNDPPEFDFSEAVALADPAASGPHGEIAVQIGSSKCTTSVCEVFEAGVLTDIWPGPAQAIDEREDQLAAVQLVEDAQGRWRLPAGACGPDGAGYFQLNRMPEINTSNYNLYAVLSPDALQSPNGYVDCTITVVDDHNPPASATKVLRIRHFTPNQAPQIGDINDPQAIDEISAASHATADPIVVGIDITDGDGDTVSAADVVAGSANPTLFPTGSIVTDSCSGTGGNYTCTLHLKPTAHQNGSAVITVNATDSAGSAADPKTFTVTVNPINDAPEFTINVENAELLVTEGSGDCKGPLCYGIAEDFLTDLRAGPPAATDENRDPLDGGQVVELNTVASGSFKWLPAGSCVGVDDVDPLLFFVGGAMPQIDGPSSGPGQYRLTVLLSKLQQGAVDCTIRVEDDGAQGLPNVHFREKTLRIRYQAAAVP